MANKVAQIKPLIITARMPTPALGIIHTLTPSPLAVGVTINHPVTPVIPLPLAVATTLVTPHGLPETPLHVTVTIVTPTHT